MPLSLKKPTTESRRDFILSIDPSINKLGYSVTEVVPENNNLGYDLKIRDCGLAESNEEMATRKITQMIQAMDQIVFTYKCTGIVVEIPPSTMYVAPGDAPHKIIARAQSVFKVVAVAHSLIQHYIFRGKQVLQILPAQWEEHHTRRNGMEVKDWTVMEANRLLSMSGISRVLQKKTKDSNIADAVLIGYRATLCALQGKVIKED